MISLLLPPPLTAAIVFVVMIAIITALVLALLPFALLKALVPIPAFQRACSDLVVAIAERWGALNTVVYRMFYPVSWDIDIRGTLEPNRSYLVICNHQSWIDIVLLVHAFRGRLPFPRFFLKRELLWTPAIGLACWALEMPFMKRHSRETLEKHPELKGEDLETTRRACQKYRERPVTVVNFVEGTRFTEAKRAARRSPYRHLLPPKAAGLSFALNVMGDQFAGIVNVTIAYRPTTHKVVWSFLTGEQNHLALHAEVQPLPQELLTGDYQTDAEFRARFQTWINALWMKKDQQLDRMLAAQNTSVRPRTI